MGRGGGRSGGGKHFKVGRRARARKSHEAKEKEEAVRNAEALAAQEAERKRVMEERMRKHQGVISSRGLLGLGLRDALVSSSSSGRKWVGDKASRSEKKQGKTSAASAKEAYTALLSGLARSGNLSKAVKSRLEASAEGGRRCKGGNGEDEDEASDGFYEGEEEAEEIHYRSEEEEDEEEGSEDENEYEDDEDEDDVDDEEEESSDDDEASPRLAGRKRVREAHSDEEEATSDASEDEDEAAAAAGDPFFTRYMSAAATLTPEAAAAAAAASNSLSPLDAWPADVPAAWVGLGADSANGLAAVVSGPPLPASSLKLLSSVSPSAAAASLDERVLVVTGGAGESAPALPIVDLEAERVKAKVATAWAATYGAETEALARKAEKTRKRLEKRRAALAGGSVEQSATEAPSAAGPHPFTPLQACLWPAINGYKDVFFPARTLDNARELRNLAALHVANHALKARDLVAKHQAKIRAAAVAARVAKLARTVDAASGGGKSLAQAKAAAAASLEEEPEYRDQGFTRPRALVLLPLRHLALGFVRALLRLLGPGHQILNRNRFFKEFSEEVSGLGADYEDDEDEIAAASATGAVLASVARAKRQMMSDVEEEDDEAEEEASKTAGSDDSDEEGGSAPRRSSSGGGGALGLGSASSSSSGGAYLFNRPRQGWSARLMQKLKKARAAGKETGAGTISLNEGSSSEEEDDEGSDGAEHEGSEDEEEEEGMRGLSALAVGAGRKKKDDSILGNGVLRDRRGKVIRKKRSNKKKGDAAKKRVARPPNPRPLDYRRTFAGNIDDDFRVGISLARKTIKLYADFYDADIIIASPLGLRRIIGGEGEKGRDYDFLSSIELLVADAADMFALQNWDHVKNLLDVLNALPTKPRDTDFTRVREWNLAGLAKAYRQSIIFSSGATTELNALLRRHCSNAAGKLLVRPSYGGTISQVALSVRQTFQRITAPSLAGADDARFAYFRDKIVPELKAGVSEEAGEVLGHTLIYVPSYFDYVRVRNLLDAADLEFVTASEYSEDGDVARARAVFLKGESPIMLLTERFHFFRRYKIRGIRHLLFYAPPTVGTFYPEFVNFLGEAAKDFPVSATTLYTKYDGLALERVVGTARAPKLLEDGPKSTFFFV